MARKIGIIGMGNVGAAVAHGAIAQGLADSYVFIDINERKAEADAQDFKDAMANLANYANIVLMIMKHLKMLMLSSQLLEIFSYSTMLVRTVLLNSHLPERLFIRLLRS